MRAVIKGIGSHLPARVLTNKALESMVDTTEEWIVERTGIQTRYIAAEGELTSHLATQAALKALVAADTFPEEVDMVIVGTTTPDDTMPSTASKVQFALGIRQGAAFDVNAACSGFVYAMTVANSFIRSGQAKCILVIGAETYSRILDWSDRSTCILFGDGAGAVVLKAEPDMETAGSGVLYSQVFSDGQYASLIGTSGGVSSTKTAGLFFMLGKEVFRHAVAKMADCTLQGLASLGLTPAHIDWLIPHQANKRILASVAQKLGVSDDHIVTTVQDHANTASASIPLALAAGVKDGRVQPGQLIAMPALGAGLTWGVTLVRL